MTTQICLENKDMGGRNRKSHQKLLGGGGITSVKKGTFKGVGGSVSPSLHCRRILGGRNLVRVRNIVVAAIFDFMTVEDWGE